MQVAVEQLPNKMMALRPILSLKSPHGQAAVPTAKEEAAACCAMPLKFLITRFTLRVQFFGRNKFFFQTLGRSELDLHSLPQVHRMRHSSDWTGAGVAITV